MIAAHVQQLHFAQIFKSISAAKCFTSGFDVLRKKDKCVLAFIAIWSKNVYIDKVSIVLISRSAIT